MNLNKVVPSCSHCRYSDLTAETFPCSTCSDEYEHFTPKPECTSCIHGSRSSGEPACSVCNDTKGEATSVCNDCEYNGTPRLTYPCTRCMANPINIALQKSAEAGYQKFVDEMNSRPTPCICGKDPEYVETVIYPGEVHRYVVCNGDCPVPHSLSVHGGNSREETIGRWNTFIFNLKQNK